MNGRSGPRGTGGRFVSTNDVLMAPIPPMAQCSLIASSHQLEHHGTVPTSAQGQQMSLLQNHSHTDRPLRYAAMQAREAMATSDGSDDGWTMELQNSSNQLSNTNVQDPVVAQHIQGPAVPMDSDGTPVMAGVEHILREAATENSNFVDTICHFDDLVGDAVLASFDKRQNGAPRNIISTFRAYMVYECARDRRSLGNSLLYATSIDAPFSTHGLCVVQNGYTVVEVVSPDMREACKLLFLETKLLYGAEDDVDADMALFSDYPFYMIACKSGDRVHAACVFRVHSLNSGNRLLVLELIASDPNDTTTIGAGTALMQVLRSLSMLSPRHSGHISGSTLRTKDSRDFYARQLPECNSPQARAFAVSVSFLDNKQKLQRHLDVRCVAVWPQFPRKC
jgi:hypothetical protein